MVKDWKSGVKGVPSVNDTSAVKDTKLTNPTKGEAGQEYIGNSKPATHPTESVRSIVHGGEPDLAAIIEKSATLTGLKNQLDSGKLGAVSDYTSEGMTETAGPNERVSVSDTSSIREGKESVAAPRVIEEYLRNRETRVASAIDEIEQLVNGLETGLAAELSPSGKGRLRDFVEDVHTACDYLREKLTQLRSNVDAARSMFVELESLREDIGDLRDEIEGLRIEGESAHSRHDSEETSDRLDRDSVKGFDRLLRWIKKAMRSLWQLVSELSTPKEWSIKGDFKVFPYFANAGMEIKFGR